MDNDPELGQHADGPDAAHDDSGGASEAAAALANAERLVGCAPEHFYSIGD
ncbi:hypothetical protein C8035_v008304 [Colletotrichum spinosum]|uniref:Uncharacterized protein n=1 Tax=Colletotrichum spinosum TaxID=1347390 RepID=A0A4R8QQA2_9PEZI|nr:hypothetical protein C8035_v008304 [Colletotrichum spinosum]